MAALGRCPPASLAHGSYSYSYSCSLPTPAVAAWSDPKVEDELVVLSVTLLLGGMFLVCVAAVLPHRHPCHRERLPRPNPNQKPRP